MRELLIGQMAELNCVSEKTLRVYHEQGLLVPVRIDPQTGYRYYSLDQCATLDMIQQLKAIGLTLDQIKTVARKQDVNYLATLMNEQAARLDAEIRDLMVSRQIAENILINCDTYENGPVCNEILIETLPERRIARVTIPELDINDPTESAMAILEAWELDLRLVKHELLKRGYPLSLFRRVGCMISQDDLVHDMLCFKEAFIFVDAACTDIYESADVVPGGTFVTMYCDHMINEKNKYTESLGIRQLLRHIAESGYRIAGDYLGEIIAETPAFLYSGRDMMFKLQIPIER